MTGAKFEKCFSLGLTVLLAFDASATSLRPASGEMTILHGQGEIFFDPPATIAPGLSNPTAVVVVDLDRAQASDGFHDLLVLDDDSITLLENRPQAGLLGLNAILSYPVGQVPGPTAGSSSSIGRLLVADLPASRPPFIISMATDDANTTDLRLFEVSPDYQGSPDDPNTELFTNRNGAPLVNLGTPGDPLSIDGATDLALAILEISEGLVVVGNDAGLVFIRSFECIPELPPEVEPACFPEGGAPELALFDSFTIDGVANSIAVIDRQTLTFALTGRFTIDGVANTPGVIFISAVGGGGLFAITQTYNFAAIDLVPIAVEAIASEPIGTAVAKRALILSQKEGSDGATVVTIDPLGTVVTVADFESGTPRLLAVGDLGSAPNGQPDLIEDFLVVMEDGPKASIVHVFKNRGFAGFLPSDPVFVGPAPVVAPLIASDVRLVDAAFGFFNSDGARDVVLVDHAGSRLVLLRAQPPPVATFISAAANGHRGQDSALGENGLVLPNTPELDDFSEDLFAAITAINGARRLPLPNQENPELDPVRYIGINAHWENSTVFGATALIGTRIAYTAAMLAPAPLCFENLALPLAVIAPDLANQVLPLPDTTPPEFWVAILFIFIPPIAPITTLVCVPPFGIPNPGSAARLGLSALAIYLEEEAVRGTRMGSAFAAADLQNTTDLAVNLARQDSPCGRVFVDTIGHSRGTTVMTEALRNLTTTGLGYNAGVSMTLLEAIDASFAPGGPYPAPGGDSARPWAKGGFLTGDPRVEAVGNVLVSSGFASLPAPFLGTLLDSLIEDFGAVATDLPIGLVLPYVMGFPIGHDREQDLLIGVAFSAPASAGVFGQVGPPINHNDFENSFFVGTDGRGVLEGGEATFEPIRNFTMGETSRIGRLLGADPRDSIPLFRRGWVRTRAEFEEEEDARLPLECGGNATPPLPQESLPFVATSAFGAHRVRQFTADPNFNRARGLVRHAKSLVENEDALKLVENPDARALLDVFLVPAARSTFPSLGAWKPNMDEDCAAPLPPEGSALDDPRLAQTELTLADIGGFIDFAQGSAGLSGQASGALERAQKRLLKVEKEIDKEKPVKVVKQLRKVQKALQKAEQHGASTGEAPRRVAALSLVLAEAIYARGSAIMAPDNSHVVEARLLLDRGLTFLNTGDYEAANKDAAKAAKKVGNDIEYEGVFCAADVQDFLAAQACRVAGLASASTALHHLAGDDDKLEKAVKRLEKAAEELARGRLSKAAKPLQKAAQRLAQASAEAPEIQSSLDVLLASLVIVMEVIAEGPPPPPSLQVPCILALGTEEQDFAEALRTRMIEARIGALPELANSPNDCDADCLAQAQTLAAEALAGPLEAWSAELGTPDDDPEMYRDKTQYLERLLSGATQTGEAFARFLEKESTLTQWLDPASGLASTLRIEVEYRFTTEEGSLWVEIAGHGLSASEGLVATPGEALERARLIFTADRSLNPDLRAIDVLTLRAKDLDLLSVTVRTGEPLVNPVDQHLYDVVLIEGGVDFDHALAAARRTIRNGQAGELASVHDIDVLKTVLQQHSVEFPVWVGARGVPTDVSSFANVDGSAFDLFPWASDVEFDIEATAPAYVYAALEDGDPVFRHSPQQTMRAGKPYAFLIDFGEAANAGNASRVQPISERSTQGSRALKAAAVLATGEESAFRRIERNERDELTGCQNLGLAGTRSLGLLSLPLFLVGRCARRRSRRPGWAG